MDYEPTIIYLYLPMVNLPIPERSFTISIDLNLFLISSCFTFSLWSKWFSKISQPFSFKNNGAFCIISLKCSNPSSTPNKATLGSKFLTSFGNFS